jgi:hypothetical protein
LVQGPAEVIHGQKLTRVHGPKNDMCHIPLQENYLQNGYSLDKIYCKKLLESK